MVEHRLGDRCREGRLIVVAPPNWHGDANE
jgi:hypothetical protein